MPTRSPKSSLSTWVGLLDQVAAFRPRIYLTGGEPTLYPHFAALLTEAKRRGFVVPLGKRVFDLKPISAYVDASEQVDE